MEWVVMGGAQFGKAGRVYEFWTLPGKCLFRSCLNKILGFKRSLGRGEHHSWKIKGCKARDLPGQYEGGGRRRTWWWLAKMEGEDSSLRDRVTMTRRLITGRVGAREWPKEILGFQLEWQHTAWYYHWEYGLSERGVTALLWNMLGPMEVQVYWTLA